MSVVVNDAHSFHLEARWQGACAVCGATGAFQAHHVVSRQLLRRLRLPQDDTRNALRLCRTCHMQFEWAGPGKVVVAVAHWRDQNVCYAFEVLGPTVVQLERKYGDITSDPRWRAHVEERCVLCQ